MPSVVRPELGPTLPELLGPRLRALPRGARVAAAALLAVAVLAVAALLLGGGGTTLHPVVVRRPLAFNFVFRAPFQRLAPRAGELARVGGIGQSLVVRELRLPAYRGDAAGFLPIWSSRVSAQMEARLPGYQLRSEGRANINKIQGYELVFQYRPAGHLVFGRRILLLPTTTARQGVELELLAPRTLAVARADAVGHNGPLKTALRSFRFGTQRP